MSKPRKRRRKPLVPPYERLGTNWMVNPSAMQMYGANRADAMGWLLWILAWPFRAVWELVRRWTRIRRKTMKTKWTFEIKYMSKEREAKTELATLRKNGRYVGVVTEELAAEIVALLNGLK